MTLLNMLIVAAVIAPQAQSRPNLSGAWVISGAESGLLGEKFSAVQDEKTLTLTITVAALGRDVKVVYNLDGTESRNMNPRGPGVPDEPIFSRVSWDAGRLIIVTRGSIPVDGKIVESKRALWIDQQGLLTIERTSEGAQPLRSVYRKANPRT